MQVPVDSCYIGSNNSAFLQQVVKYAHIHIECGGVAEYVLLTLVISFCVCMTGFIHNWWHLLQASPIGRAFSISFSKFVSKFAHLAVLKQWCNLQYYLLASV